MFSNKNASASLVFLAAFVAIPASVQAGCVPSVTGSPTYNTCVGGAALGANVSSTGNTALGYGAMERSTRGSYNTASGHGALGSIVTANGNTATGAGALGNVRTSNNTAVGMNALGLAYDSSNNTAVGYYAGAYFMSGSYNTVVGNEAGSKQTGSYNVSIGYQAATSANPNDGNFPGGNNNIALGYRAGSSWMNGGNNIAIGAPGTSTDNNTIRIGVQGRQSTTVIAGIRGSGVSGGAAVLVDANGRLGIATSSRRYKQDIAPMGDASDALMQLRPVTFRYKQPDSDGAKPLQYGLIAEEVAEVIPELVVRNADGSPETVAYHVLPSLLLNEYQKQNRELAETKARLAAMEQEMSALRAAVNRISAGPQPAAYQAP